MSIKRGFREIKIAQVEKVFPKTKRIGSVKWGLDYRSRKSLRSNRFSTIYLVLPHVNEDERPLLTERKRLARTDPPSQQASPSATRSFFSIHGLDERTDRLKKWCGNSNVITAELGSTRKVQSWCGNSTNANISSRKVELYLRGIRKNVEFQSMAFSFVYTHVPPNGSFVSWPTFASN